MREVADLQAELARLRGNGTGSGAGAGAPRAGKPEQRDGAGSVAGQQRQPQGRRGSQPPGRGRLWWHAERGPRWGWCTCTSCAATTPCWGPGRGVPCARRPTRRRPGMRDINLIMTSLPSLQEPEDYDDLLVRLMQNQFCRLEALNEGVLGGGMGGGPPRWRRNSSGSRRFLRTSGRQRRRHGPASHAPPRSTTHSISININNNSNAARQPQPQQGHPTSQRSRRGGHRQ